MRDGSGFADEFSEYLEEALSEIGRLRTALDTIVRTSKTGGAVEIARAALTKQSITDAPQPPSQTDGDG